MHREAVSNWVTRAEIDSDQRPGVTTQEHKRIVALLAEKFELRRANEIPKSAAILLRGRARPPTEAVIAYIEANRTVFGVEPICETLAVAPSTYYADPFPRTLTGTQDLIPTLSKAAAGVR